ncbi:EAL domain-containing protein [Xylophilus sp. GOD-11R]|uniref:sensor domain-containing protein n=1 Tax=Xylophilus sp. GOD-11R TaxID=3089814 RepID=UPI00298C80FE|nr:EAL domain-containing protein [Xylophilus sp. GOD-11R]WPB58551.1 EAL domain-containing protein [Xylophilus sp. GOD-11R]
MSLAASAAWIDGLLEAVWIVEGPEFHVLATNAAAAQLTERSTAAMVGQPVTHLFTDPEDVFFWENAEHDRAAGLLSNTRLLRPDGTVLHVERRITPIAPAGQVDKPTWLVGVVDRSRQQKNEDELERLLAESRATLESTADGMLVCGLDGAIRAFNRRFAQIWEIPKEVLVQRDDTVVHRMVADQLLDMESYRGRLSEIFGEIDQSASDVMLLRSGRVVQRLSLPQFSRGRVIGRVFSFQDITERISAEQGLRLAARVFECSPEAVFVADAQHRIVTANPACCRMARYPLERLAGSSATDLFEDHDAGRLFTDIRSAWESAGMWEGEVWHRRGDGSVCPVKLAWVVLRDGHGSVSQTIGFFRDLSGQREAQRRIEELAFSDALTGLPNRLLLARRVDRQLSPSKREKLPFAVLFLDLDRFKNINDSMGHQFGDRVLVKVAERVKACLRPSDTLCRMGGDEFVVHLHDADALSAEGVAQRVLQSLALPFLLEDMRFSVSASIGISLYPQDGNSLDDLVRHADTAMFRVKERGRGSYRFYAPEMNVDLRARMSLEHAMREALARRRFVLHYQPQLHLRSGAMVGVEALIRWVDEERGNVVPSAFIPLAEESGFIVQIGAWVLEEAVRQAAVWQQAGTAVVVSINVSPLQFRQADFVDRVASAIRVAGVSPELIELELTESILVQEADEALQRLHELVKVGVRLAIDDFGTGYSSLAYLKKFPIHRVKIDQSFVRELPNDSSDHAIVTAMLAMARALRFDTVAEGVETEAQRDCLLDLGCAHFQGFLCAPGLPASDIGQRLRDGESFRPVARV